MYARRNSEEGAPVSRSDQQARDGWAGVTPAADATVLEPGGPNAIARAAGIVGDEWSLLIIATALSHGLTRFTEWQQAMPISSSVLSQRLAGLLVAGVFEREEGSTERHRYPLSERGRALWPVLLSIWAWERRYNPVPPPQMTQLRHASCLEIVDPRLACAHCGRTVRRADLDAGFGPSGSWRRSTPSGVARRRPASVRPGEPRLEAGRLLGDRASAAVIGAAALGATRFSEFEHRAHANPTVVAERLRTFCAIGVLATEPSPERTDRLVYRLTEKGEDFYAVIATMVAWGERWFVSPEGPALIKTHRDCGAAFVPRLECGACGKRLTGRTVLHESA